MRFQIHSLILALVFCPGVLAAATLTTQTNINGSCGVTELWTGGAITPPSFTNMDRPGRAAEAFNEAVASGFRVGASAGAQIELDPPRAGGFTQTSLSSTGCASSTGNRFFVAGPGTTAEVGLTLNLTGSGFALSLEGITKKGLIVDAMLYGVDEFGQQVSSRFTFSDLNDGPFPSSFTLPSRVFDITQPLFLDIEMRVSSFVQVFVVRDDGVVRNANAELQLNYTNTLGIDTSGGPVFDLPAGFTAFSDDGLIVNNRFVDPTLPPSAVPLPASGALLLVGLGLLVNRREKRTTS